ncbi:lysophospholipid acyltransferase family protein [Levilactobacillus bambusae]|uniref:1-acyl-sn-glycerol-3-phosphate acyltransferase n=1 Tax=Levilactobacillus bambusae TaxID=2024736 RepID=A0A2V1N0F6_9LACO|nr:1-acyl-sn-glycerol-3-phosphate acyltransferase [Levilactobacillus bambusae]PWG00717.1 1-acyl-sn-glycerol-3-phosphate acyltransferase [Levilactobacillus bambusae]
MLYSFLRVLIRALLILINGNIHYDHQDRLPNQPYILVAPHRTWFDPVLFALGTKRKFAFMAKEELFKNPILRWILVHVHAFPVDRQNPGPSAIKVPVKILKKGDDSLIIFPSGSRHSAELKGGAIVIAKLAGVPLVPAVYQGPLTFMRLFSRKRITVSYGDPIYVDRKLKLTDENQKLIEDQMQESFDALDKEIDPDWHYVDVTGQKHRTID